MAVLVYFYCSDVLSLVSPHLAKSLLQTEVVGMGEVLGRGESHLKKVKEEKLKELFLRRKP